MTTYEATVISRGDQRLLKFRKMAALVRRLGGTHYKVEQADAGDPSTRQVTILRKDERGTHVWRRVVVPSDAVKDADKEGMT